MYAFNESLLGGLAEAKPHPSSRGLRLATATPKTFFKSIHIRVSCKRSDMYFKA
jgi:hypothetical protein